MLRRLISYDDTTITDGCQMKIPSYLSLAGRKSNFPKTSVCNSLPDKDRQRRGEPISLKTHNVRTLTITTNFNPGGVISYDTH